MLNIMSFNKHQEDYETVAEYIWRICTIKKELDLTWNEVAELLNTNLNLNYSVSWYRKNFKEGKFEACLEFETTSSECFSDNCESCDKLQDCLSEWAQELSDKESKLNDKQNELLQKRVEISDLVTQNNAYIRRLSREQTIKDIAHDYALTMSKDKLLELPQVAHPYCCSTNEGILLISDWHYGMVCYNSWNTFDPSICKQRVSKLLVEVINIVNTCGIDHVHVLDLADLIAGRIHTQICIESRFDVITQTMDVAEILAEFLNELSYHCKISFYSCLDNHSRLEPNKKESMDLESLARLIPWYLVERLKNNDNIEIHDNEYGADIITCNVCGHRVIGVHGDNDSPTSALERLSLMTHEHYSLLCTAHRHHFHCNEDHQSMIVSNSSLMGVDSYAEKLRLTSDPSQTFIVSSKENVCECIYRIVLK